MSQYASCNEKGGSSGLHRASTFELDYKAHQIATGLRDSKVLSKLAAGDMVAIEAQYHTLCLAKFYKHAKQYERNQDNDLNEPSALHGIAFAELISYIESYQESPETWPVFKLQTLKKLYSDRIEELGAENGQLHTIRFKERILAAVPDLQAQNKGKEVLLAFMKDIGPALKHAFNADYDTEGMLLAKAANNIHRDIFKIKQIFNGQFIENCQQKSVPTTLTSLISMILNGPNIKDQLGLEGINSQASLTISQLVAFNIVKSRPLSALVTGHVRHNRDRETPDSIYLALKVHGETRKRELVDTFHSMGLCISYPRLLPVSANVANSVCHMYKEQGVVCPPQLSSGVFTTAVVDNIDHNPSSTTSMDSFHGTSISLAQHPREGKLGTKRDHPIITGLVTNEKQISV